MKKEILYNLTNSEATNISVLELISEILKFEKVDKKVIDLIVNTVERDQQYIMALKKHIIKNIKEKYDS